MGGFIDNAVALDSNTVVMNFKNWSGRRLSGLKQPGLINLCTKGGQCCLDDVSPQQPSIIR